MLKKKMIHPRWTPEDVAMAKALKGYGVVKIKKDECGNVICYDADDGAFSIIYDYIKTFDGAERDKFVNLDTIINEAEV